MMSEKWRDALRRASQQMEQFARHRLLSDLRRGRIVAYRRHGDTAVHFATRAAALSDDPALFLTADEVRIAWAVSDRAN